MVNLTLLAPDISWRYRDEAAPLDVTLLDLAVDPPEFVRGAAGADFGGTLADTALL